MSERKQKYTLRDTTLEGIDPNDPKLTTEQKLAILEECRINPEYFFAAVCQYPSEIRYSYLNTEYLLRNGSIRPQAQVIKLPTGRDVSVVKPRLPFLDPLNTDN